MWRRSNVSEKERLLRRLAAMDFAILEFHIFLDTHPNNEEIADKLEKYSSNAKELRAEFEKKYGPITPNTINGNQWAWISNPWPWDNTDEGGNT